MGKATLDKIIEISNSLTFVKDRNVEERLNAGDERNDQGDDGERNNEEGRNNSGEENERNSGNEEQRERTNDEGREGQRERTNEEGNEEQREHTNENEMENETKNKENTLMRRETEMEQTGTRVRGVDAGKNIQKRGNMPRKRQQIITKVKRKRKQPTKSVELFFVKSPELNHRAAN